MKLNVLYFARLRETFGTGAETVDIPGGRVADLIDLLRARGRPWSEELDGQRAFRIAVNQDIADLDTVLNDRDEVAIFPPVTGG